MRGLCTPITSKGYYLVNGKSFVKVLRIDYKKRVVVLRNKELIAEMV